MGQVDFCSSKAVIKSNLDSVLKKFRINIESQFTRVVYLKINLKKNN